MPERSSEFFTCGGHILSRSQRHAATTVGSSSTIVSHSSRSRTAFTDDDRARHDGEQQQATTRDKRASLLAERFDFRGPATFSFSDQADTLPPSVQPVLRPARNTPDAPPLLSVSDERAATLLLLFFCMMPFLKMLGSPRSFRICLLLSPASLLLEGVGDWCRSKNLEPLSCASFIFSWRRSCCAGCCCG